MNRLTKETLRGVWAGVTMSWDESYGFDEKSYRANIENAIKDGVHGIYTTGSTGEFYALNFDEFKAMVDVQAELCGAQNAPLQIGCCAANTREVIRMMEYAASKEVVGAAQVCLPFWMELTDKEVLRFFADIAGAVPDLPIVHYNIPRAKRFLGASDYQQILDVAPTLVGVKYTFAGTHFGALQECLIKLPQIGFYVGENLLASGTMLGAIGSCSSLVSTNAAWMLEYYDHARNGRWDAAITMQKTAAQFFEDAANFIATRGEGAIDPVFDKGLGVAAGGVLGSQRTRAPYIGWSDETVIATNAWLQKFYPQFLASQ
jgi:dihydrodipicolinate synthase/N-acetylneuraminate lyase